MPALSLILLFTGLFISSVQAQVDSASAVPYEVFTVVEQPPQFPGGMNKLGDYFQTNLVYPEAARLAKLEGRVFVTFIVMNNGKIEDVKVLKRLGKGTDEEAVRLIKSMPNWIPGKQAGIPVNVRYNLPVNFKLNG